MILPLFLFFLTSPDPCNLEISGKWRTIRHGDEEIRFERDGQTMLLAVRNTGKSTGHVDVIWRELGFSGAAQVFDLTSNKDEGKVRSGFARKLAPGACAGYRLILP